MPLIPPSLQDHPSSSASPISATPASASRFAPAFLLLFAATGFTYFNVRADDQWWHMLTGRYILEYGHVPATDPFSFTFAGAPWVNWEWLAGLLMMLSWKAGGSAGLVTLRILAEGGAMLALLLALYRIEKNHFHAVGHYPLTVALIGCLTLLVLFGRIGDRPHVYAYPLLVLFPLVSELFLKTPRLILFLLLWVMLAVWMVLHPSWMLGASMFVALAADQFIRLRREEGFWRAWRSMRMAAAGGAILGITAILLHNPFAYSSSVNAIFRSDALSEWRPVTRYLRTVYAPVEAFLVLAVAWLLLLIRDLYRQRRLRTVDILLLLTLATAVRYVRFTEVFALLAAPDIFRRLIAPASPERRLPLRLATLLAVLTCILGMLAMLHTNIRSGHRAGMSLDVATNPVGVADFMQEHQLLSGNIFSTTMESTSYLVFRGWPAAKGFIDGRVPQLFPMSFLQYYISAGDPSTLDALLDRYPVDHLIVMGSPLGPATTHTAALYARSDFSLAYLDDYASLYSRNSALRRARPVLEPILLADPWTVNEGWLRNAEDPLRFQIIRKELWLLAARSPRTVVLQQMVRLMRRWQGFSAEQKRQLRDISVFLAGGSDASEHEDAIPPSTLP